jgi:hypothetical protein
MRHENSFTDAGVDVPSSVVWQVAVRAAPASAI